MWCGRLPVLPRCRGRAGLSPFPARPHLHQCTTVSVLVVASHNRHGVTPLIHPACLVLIIFQVGRSDHSRPVRGGATIPAGRLLISAALTYIDGASGILGSAGPDASWLACPSISYTGNMNFDVGDVVWMQNAGTFESVIMHEMGHVIGLGCVSPPGVLVRIFFETKLDAVPSDRRRENFIGSV